MTPRDQMGDLWLIYFLLYFGPPLFLIALGYVAGRIIERRHLKSIAEREARLALAVPTNLKTVPSRPVAGSFLVMGSVVIASDFYKTFGARLKSMVGGRLGTLETLMERGRREAVLRMREQAASYGAQVVFNVRLETSTIVSSQGRNSMPGIEVMAYGTAVIFKG